MKPAAGSTLRNRCTSAISYSSLNFLRVIDRSFAASTTPLCANSMILDATKRMARSSLSCRPNSAHTVSNTTEMLQIASGAKATMKQEESYGDDEAGGHSGNSPMVPSPLSAGYGVIRCAVDL
jgi:hypothetical protein